MLGYLSLGYLSCHLTHQMCRHHQKLFLSPCRNWALGNGRQKINGTLGGLLTCWEFYYITLSFLSAPGVSGFQPASVQVWWPNLLAVKKSTKISAFHGSLTQSIQNTVYLQTISPWICHVDTSQTTTVHLLIKESSCKFVNILSLRVTTVSH